MNTVNDDNIFFSRLQLPLGFNRSDTGDLHRILAFLDDSSAAGIPVSLSDVFSWFSGQPDAWYGRRFARSISLLITDHMISCVMNGNTFQNHHSSIFLEYPDQWAQIQIIPRKRLSMDELKEVVTTCQTILCMDCPDDQDGLTRFLIGCLNRWKSSLTVFHSLAEAGNYPGAADIRSCLSFIQAWLAITDPFEKISFVLNGKVELSSFYDMFVRLKDFFETRTARWESWRKSLENFTDFQPALEKDAEVASDLSKLRHVLEMAHPWDELEGMDALIVRIKPVYERIRNEKYDLLQDDTLSQIEGMIKTISQLLEKVHARSDVRNMALVELQKIKKTIAIDMPNSHIVQTAGNCRRSF